MASSLRLSKATPDKKLVDANQSEIPYVAHKKATRTTINLMKYGSIHVKRDTSTNGKTQYPNTQTD
jgi:hypothetical protein